MQGTSGKQLKVHIIQFQNQRFLAFVMVLLDFNEYLNIIAEPQYAERLVLYIETAELALIIQN